MKKLITITFALSIILSLLILTSCSVITGEALETNDEELQKAVIESYLHALLRADTDAFLDTLDPAGPLYPRPEAIEKLRASENGSALKGNAGIENLSIIEKSTNRVQVRVEVFSSIDFENTGEFRENRTNLIFELTFIDGKWLIYNYTNE